MSDRDRLAPATCLIVLATIAGCASSPESASVNWDPEAPTAMPVRVGEGAVGLDRPFGWLVVRTSLRRDSNGTPRRRGFAIFQQSGRLVRREGGFDESEQIIWLAPGRYVIVARLETGGPFSELVSQQAVVAAGQATTVDLSGPH